MKSIFFAIFALVMACALGIISAKAHTATVPHDHPHLHTVDGALLGFDGLSLVALALITVSGGCAALVLARRSK